MFEQKIRDTSGISMFLFRAALFLAFLLMAGRLYQLQIVQGDSYRARGRQPVYLDRDALDARRDL